MPLNVMVVEDDERLGPMLVRHLERKSAQVQLATSLAHAREILEKSEGLHLVLADDGLPDGRGRDVLDTLAPDAPKPALILMTGNASVEIAVDALRNGARDFLAKPFGFEALDSAIARVLSPFTKVAEEPMPPGAGEQWRTKYAPRFVGQHTRVIQVFDVLARVAETDCAILVFGETGTGKELVAKAIHAASPRGAHTFVPVNCAAVPETLIESELFGHARGAFTGAATARAGRFQAAHKGTLFLDEIGEIPLSVQAKLLRALQEKEITPLGESRPTKVDVRIVAATHRDLDEMVSAREFREDLLYRLDVIRVELPPLRARASDIPLLVNSFIEEANSRRAGRVTGVSPKAMDALLAYSWPGNIRQLQNVVERMVVMRGEGMVEIEDIPEKVRGSGTTAVRTSFAPVLPDEGIDLRDAVERFENALIRQALERTGWNKNRAATILHMNRTTLVEKLKKKGWSEDDTSGGSSSQP